MRDFPSFSALTLLAALTSTACASSTPTPTAPADAPTPDSTVQADPVPAPNKPSTPEDEAWVGEKTSKTVDGDHGGASAQAPVDGKAPETRTLDVIRKLVMDNRKAARKCYEDARKDQKDLQGDVVIHFVLDPEGKVKSADLNQERSTLKAPSVVECVIGVIKSIPFPRSSRAMETTTNYPFNFTP